VDLALFDFDGTITSGDTWTPFMRTAVRPSRRLAGRALLAPAYVGYKCGFTTAGRVREIAARIGFTGEDAAAVGDAGRRYAHETLPGMVRRRAQERIEWHQSRGDHIVVVSASLDVYLGPWCEERQLSYICTTLEHRNGKLTGKCVDGDCSGHEKPRRILERCQLSEYELIYAYGDTPDDGPMLALAQRKYYRWKQISGSPEPNSETPP
jgi:HAD superfamily hydrolase (TIGR01490 family)